MRIVDFDQEQFHYLLQVWKLLLLCLSIFIEPITSLVPMLFEQLYLLLCFIQLWLELMQGRCSQVME
jgi:hypothetical protein